MPASHDPRLSRRDFFATASIAAAGGWAMLAGARFAFGDEPAGATGDQGVVQMMRNGAAKAKIESQHLGGNVYVLIGSGGNIGVLAGDDGILLVDSGLAGSQPQITEALAKINAKPLKYVINTHWHFDHCDGNAWTRGLGATIIAHPNTKRHLSKETRVPDWNFTFPPTPENALPNEVVAERKQLKFNNIEVDIRHYGFPCHTDGDLLVRFGDGDVLQTGDTFWNGHYPFIDTANGGSIGGTLRATEENLKLVTEKTKIIPGHGPVASRADLAEFRDMIAGVQEAVAKLKKEGKSVDEAVAAKPTAKWDAKYAGFVITPEHFTRIAYAGV